MARASSRSRAQPSTIDRRCRRRRHHHRFLRPAPLMILRGVILAHVPVGFLLIFAALFELLGDGVGVGGDNGGAPIAGTKTGSSASGNSSGTANATNGGSSTNVAGTNVGAARYRHQRARQPAAVRAPAAAAGASTPSAGSGHALQATSKHRPSLTCRRAFPEAQGFGQRAQAVGATARFITSPT